MKRTMIPLIFALLFYPLLSPRALYAQWENGSNGQLPEKALKVSTTLDGKPMYIARTTIDGGVIARAVVSNELTVGKIQQGGSALIPWGGKEHYVNQYEVLAKQVVVSHSGNMEGLFAIKLFNNKALDADLPTIIKVNGVRVMVWDYSGGDKQLWKVQHLGNGYYKITNLASGKALSAWNDDVNKNGCRITLWDYWGGDSQQWKIEMFSLNKFAIRCKGSTQEKALDIDKNKLGENGTNAQLYDYWEGINQFWTFEKINRNLPPDPTDPSPPIITWEVLNETTGEIKKYTNGRTIKVDRTGSYTVTCNIEDIGGLKEWHDEISIAKTCKCGDLYSGGAPGSRAPAVFKPIALDAEGKAVTSLQKKFEAIYLSNTCGRRCAINLSKMAYVAIKNYAGLLTEGWISFEYNTF